MAKQLKCKKCQYMEEVFNTLVMVTLDCPRGTGQLEKSNVRFVNKKNILDECRWFKAKEDEV